MAAYRDSSCHETVRLPSGRPDLRIRAIDKGAVDLPVILRPTGTHGGKIIGCFTDVDSLRAAMEGSGDLIGTEFIDFRSSDGLYRKLRVFFFGSEMVLRHQLVSDHWNVHAKDRERFMAGRAELIAEESALLENPTDAFAPDVRGVLAAVRDRMPLDFFGMDFARLSDGRLVLFEANAAMSFFPLSEDPQFAYLHRALEPAQKAFRKLLGLAPELPAQPMTRIRLHTA